MTKKQNLLKGFIKENPLFVTLLGTCPALATTTSIESAFGMGILFMFVLIGSNVFISLLRKIIPDQVKIPCYIVVIATFVTIVKMLSEAFLPELYSSLGVFISLIVVNCIVLGRAEAYASKAKPVDAIIDGIGMGIGYGIAIIMIAFVRELLGEGTITIWGNAKLEIYKWLHMTDYKISFFTSSAGAFLVLGIILGVLQGLKNHKALKAKEGRVNKK